MAADTFGRLYPALMPPAACALFLALLAAGPALARRLWKTPDLETGELRDRLVALARRACLPVPRLLVLPGERSPNAAIVGLTPRSRCVILTEGLIRVFGREQVEAVFAHEAGHARGGHILHLFFLIASFLFLSYPLQAAAAVLPAWAAAAGAAVFVLAYWWIVFGAVSRRFELEADLAAADLIGTAAYAPLFFTSTSGGTISSSVLGGIIGPVSGCYSPLPTAVGRWFDTNEFNRAPQRP